MKLKFLLLLKLSFSPQYFYMVHANDTIIVENSHEYNLREHV